MGQCMCQMSDPQEYPSFQGPHSHVKWRRCKWHLFQTAHPHEKDFLTLQGSKGSCFNLRKIRTPNFEVSVPYFWCTKYILLLWLTIANCSKKTRSVENLFPKWIQIITCFFVNSLLKIGGRFAYWQGPVQVTLLLRFKHQWPTDYTSKYPTLLRQECPFRHSKTKLPNWSQYQLTWKRPS